MAGRRWALVLAGGDGARLQEMMREICGARIPHELVVVPVEGVHWSDWGTRASIERALMTLDRPRPAIGSGSIEASQERG